MVAPLAAVAAFVLLLGAETLHLRRVRPVAALAFGPSRGPVLWARLTPLLRVVAFTLLAWGLTTLIQLAPKVHKTGVIPESEYRHLVLVLDVSPSMRLADAGPAGKQTRASRAADLLKSFFERVPIEQYKTSVIAVFRGAKPVVVDTTDLEVIRNILTELPMQFAFKAGPTELFTGLEEAAKLARPWRPKSTTVVVLSDGDTIPGSGMPKMPDSVKHCLVVGVGDPKAGRFLDGHLSRQDVSTLRQLAVRLNGTYHDGNEKHLATTLLREISGTGEAGLIARLGQREYALMAVGCGAAVLGLLPVLLHWYGTAWRPGVPRRRASGVSP